jgi:predicted MFS family arabinose efflux permease
MSGLFYLGLALVLGGPFFRQGDERLDDLWFIYMSPMFDEENKVILSLVAFACLGLGITCFLSPFFRRVSEYLSNRRIGSFVAGVSATLAVVAITQFSQPIVNAFLFALVLCVWSWLRSDPNDSWF